MLTPGERWESYFYPLAETSGPIRTLRNRFDEHNGVVLDFLEKSAAALRGRQLNSGQVQIARTFDAAHLKAIHAHLFQDVYDWAGEFRTVDISKKDQVFAGHDGGITRSLSSAARTIREQDWQGIDRAAFARVSATVFADVNVAHPFREGNGRVTKAFLRDVAGLSGFRFDFDQVSREEWNEMARLTMPGPDESDPRPGAADQAFMAMALPGDGPGLGKSEDAEAKRLVDLVRRSFPNDHFSAAMGTLIPAGESTAADAVARVAPRAARTPPTVGRDDDFGR